MPILKMHYDNNYVSLYEEYNYRIFAKIAEYQSSLNEVYDIVTDIKIIDIDTNKVIYSTNTHMAYNSDGLISIVNYVEKILFYLHHEKCDFYWKKLFLNKLFQNMNTLHLELYYNRVTKQLQQVKERQETENIRQEIDIIKQNIQTKYNKKGYAVIYGIYELYVLNENRLISQQNNMFEYLKTIEKNIEVFKPYITRHVELNWDKSDINILNELLEIA